MHIGKLLKEERIRQGLTQDHVADKLGFTQQNVAYWENKPILNIKIIKVYTEVLNCELHALLKERE